MSFANHQQPAAWFVACGTFLRWLGIYIFVIEILSGLTSFAPEYYAEMSWDAMIGVCVSVVATGMEFLIAQLRKLPASSLQKRHHLNQYVLRILLVLTLVDYGIAKIANIQFGNEYAVLDSPLYDVDGFQLCWRFFDYSYAYKLFIGCSQLIGALLLVNRRTVISGCFILLPVMANVAFVNFTHTRIVTFTSTFDLLMILYLIATDFDRLSAVFITNKSAPENKSLAIIPYAIFNRKAFKITSAVLLVLYIVGAIVDNINAKAERNHSHLFKGAFHIKSLTSTSPTHLWRKIYLENYGRAVIKDENGESIWSFIEIDEQKQNIQVSFEDSTYEGFEGQYVIQADSTIVIHAFNKTDTFNMEWHRFLR
ncbi:MAG: hypothetical protein WC716_12795 [Chitinophagaceae bacterium]|jgi:hypothetical protein